MVPQKHCFQRACMVEDRQTMFVVTAMWTSSLITSNRFVEIIVYYLVSYPKTLYQEFLT